MSNGVIHEIPFLIKTFLKEEWPIDKLLAIQKKRIEHLLACIRKGEISENHGHYHEVGDLITEVGAHIEALRELVVTKK